MDEAVPPGRNAEPPVPGRPAPPGDSAAVRRGQRALESALRSGPFDLALRTAIACRELNLESLRRRLASRGIKVSLSTLSYWQRGIRRPERPESLRAVHAIEDILGLPRSALVSLLGPPRPRGRRREARGGVLGFEETLGHDRALSGALATLDTAVNFSFVHVSMQGERWVRADRGWAAERVRRIVTARSDGPDRFIAICVPDAADEPPPVLRALSGCRLGRVRTDQVTGVHAAELLFDIPLKAGRHHVFDYEYRPADGAGQMPFYYHASRQPIRELVLRVHFPPAVLPARCYHLRQERHDDERHLVAELQPALGGTVGLVSLDSQPGIEGLWWEWA